MSKQYKNRVCIEIMANIWTEGKTEEEAGKASEDIADDLVRYLEHQIRHADGCPGIDEVQISTWGVRNIDIEECEEEE